MGMRAVVLAGGEGARLRPLTEHTPKPMLPVGRRRCIDYALASLGRAGIDEVIVTTSYMSDRLIRGLEEGGPGGGPCILFSIEREPLGTAGAVRKVREWLDSTFVVMSADVLADVDLGALVAFHRQRGAVATMALTRVPDPTEYGIVGLDDSSRIVRFMEKPKAGEVFSDLINAGIYVLEPAALDHVPPDAKFDFSKDLFPILLEGGHGLYGSRIEGLWMDIGRPADLIAANQAVVLREGGAVSIPGADVRGPVLVGDDVVVERGVVIEGPAMLGDGAQVRAGATVSRSVVHAGAVVGPGARVEDSVMMRASSVSARAILLRTILGEGARVGEEAHVAESVLGRGAHVPALGRLHGERVEGSW
jgi:NDP-sugar pyrophosphorylase family protein